MKIERIISMDPYFRYLEASLQNPGYLRTSICNKKEKFRLGYVRLGQVRSSLQNPGYLRTSICNKKEISYVRLGQVRLGLKKLGQGILGWVRLGQVRCQIRLDQVRLGLFGLQNPGYFRTSICNKKEKIRFGKVRLGQIKLG